MLTHQALVKAKQLLEKDSRVFKRLSLLCGVGFIAITIGVLYYFHRYLPRITPTPLIYPDPNRHRWMLYSYIGIVCNYIFWLGVFISLSIRRLKAS